MSEKFKQHVAQLDKSLDSTLTKNDKLLMQYSWNGALSAVMSLVYDLPGDFRHTLDAIQALKE